MALANLAVTMTVPIFPPTLPPNSVVGRLGAGTSGPATAVPFASLGTAFVTLTGTDQPFSGGATITPAVLPAGSVTIDCGLCPLQQITNSGAFTITAPVNSGSCLLTITNAASPGAVTFNGFNAGTNVGPTPDLIAGHGFTVNIWRNGSWSGYFVYAHQ